MGRRDTLISKSILDAIFQDQHSDESSIFTRIWGFFALFNISLSRYENNVFKSLRTNVWELDEDEYRESFRSADRKGKLTPVGDMGYSGSTFFTTPNSKFLIKSLPRRFENQFFQTKLLHPYAQHCKTHPDSLLVRITDFLHAPHVTLGSLVGTASSHHIVMENILYGKKGSIDSSSSEKWETYDLKPSDYFFPERDVANGKLAPESVKDRLIDKFEDQVRVTTTQRETLLSQLEADTSLLRENNAVDYSLFLVRYPASLDQDSSQGKIPRLPSRTSPWRAGLSSRDGQWIYRAVLLDFFWAKDALHAKAMTGLIKSYNLIDRQGPMSITTSPDEYQTRFMKMVGEIVVGDDVGSSS